MKRFHRRVAFFNWIKTHRKRVALLVVMSIFIGTVYGGRGIAKDPAALQSKQVKRGEYLVNTSGCHDCHTPWIMKEDGPGPDLSRALSGHPEGLVMPAPSKLEGPWVWIGAGSNTAFAGPWGISYTKNLTPDPTGLGTWTEEEFIAAIRTGKDRDTGRPILPPMPWRVYRHFTDEDLKAIFAYLRTIPPIKNTPPLPQAPAVALVSTTP